MLPTIWLASSCGSGHEVLDEGPALEHGDVGGPGLDVHAHEVAPDRPAAAVPAPPGQVVEALRAAGVRRGGVRRGRPGYGTLGEIAGYGPPAGPAGTLRRAAAAARPERHQPCFEVRGSARTCRTCRCCRRRGHCRGRRQLPPGRSDRRSGSTLRRSRANGPARRDAGGRSAARRSRSGDRGVGVPVRLGRRSVAGPASGACPLRPLGEGGCRAGGPGGAGRVSPIFGLVGRVGRLAPVDSEVLGSELRAPSAASGAPGARSGASGTDAGRPVVGSDIGEIPSPGRADVKARMASVERRRRA